ncbi:MAG: hypothetical protein ISS74_08565 [Planctomycetes bacterium]|nr:hypothetical protein [Planctomycetota bacterium]
MSGPNCDEKPGASAESPDRRLSVLDLIRRIRSGDIASEGLDKDSRQRCVEHLTAEGYSPLEIAEILKVSDRTVRRDRKAICEAHAVQRDPRLVEEMVGRLVQRADTAVERISRAVRGKEVKPVDRIEAETACWRILKELVECLQRLGYLPTAAVQVRGDLRHSFSVELPSVADLQAEAERLEAIGRHSGAPSDTLVRIGRIQQTLRLLTAAEQVEVLGQELEGGPNDEPQT